MMHSAITGLIASLFLFIDAANAAEIFRPEVGSSEVLITGVIERGDAEKLAEVLSWPQTDEGPLWVKLASSGGDVLEAMRMGQMLRERFIPTSEIAIAMKNKCSGLVHIQQEMVLWPLDVDSCGCHSSCFVIWAGGPVRGGNAAVSDGGVDTIGIHRPYFDKRYFSGLSASEAEEEYQKITDLVTQYLRDMGIPDEFAEKMFSVSSENIYLLTNSEIDALESPPAIAEWFISKCGKFSENDENDLSSYQKRRVLAMRGDTEVELSKIEQRHYELLDKQSREYFACRQEALRTEQQLRF